MLVLRLVQCHFMQFKPPATLLKQLQDYCKVNGVDTVTAINQLLAKQLLIEDLDHNYLLTKYKAVADFNLMAIADWDGESLTVKPSSQWPAEYKGNNSPIASLAMGQFGLTIKAHDKIKAQDSIAKHLGLFGEFNVALGTLKKYGIILVQDLDGEWLVQGQDEPVQQQLF